MKGRKVIKLDKEDVLDAIEETKSKHGKVLKTLLCDELGVSFPTLDREMERLGISIGKSDNESAEIIEEDYNWIDDLLSIDGKKDDINMVVCSDLKNGDRIKLFGDVHWGNHNCNVKRLKKSLKQSYNDKRQKVICMGDLIESAIIGSPGLFDQDKFLDSQFYEIIKMLKPLAKEERILGIHPGNHEFRVRKVSGFSITKFMCEVLNTEYLGAGRMHLINYGGKQDYELYTTHGASGARYTHTKLNACEKLSEVCEVELYAMGHSHGLGDRRKTIYKIDKQNKNHIIKTIHFVLTGAYLEYLDSYAQFKSLPPSCELGSPLIKFKYDEHKIDINYV